VHFLHIGKTGGTAVKAALEPLTHGGRHSLVLHDHQTTLRNVPAGEGVVFFLRDPLTRFVSGFNSRLRQGLPKYFKPWTPEQKVIFERFPTPNQLALGLTAEITDDRTLAESAMNRIGHLRPVCPRWFENEAYFLSRLPDIFFIGFQETLATDFETLKARLGLPPEIQLPADEVAAHKTPAHFDTRLDAQAVVNLTAWYQEDIHFYQLCRRLVAENKIR